MSVMMLTLILLLRKEEGDMVEEQQEQEEEADQKPHGVEEGLEVLMPGKWSHQLLHNRTRAMMTLSTESSTWPPSDWSSSERCYDESC